VGRIAGHHSLRQAEHEAPVDRSAERQTRLWRAASDEVARYRYGTVLRRRQPRQDRVGFERAMSDQPHPAIERAARRAMAAITA